MISFRLCSTAIGIRQGGQDSATSRQGNSTATGRQGCATTASKTVQTPGNLFVNYKKKCVYFQSKIQLFLNFSRTYPAVGSRQGGQDSATTGWQGSKTTGKTVPQLQTPGNLSVKYVQRKKFRESGIEKIIVLRCFFIFRMHPCLQLCTGISVTLLHKYYRFRMFLVSVYHFVVVVIRKKKKNSQIKW